MKDWRAWPKETPKVADITSLPDWVRSPEKRLETQSETWLAIPILLIGVGLPLATLFALFGFIPDPIGNVAVGLTLTIGGLAGFVFWLLNVARWGEEWTYRRLARRVLGDLTERGESTLGDEVVGVAYADRLWRNAISGDSWDWGALRLGLDRLSFIGRASRFDLRPEQILNVEIRRSDHLLGTPKPRLYVTWQGAGQAETLSLELPYLRSRRRRVEAIEGLRERIERWRREPLPSHDRSPLVPPLGRADVQLAPSRYSQIGAPAKVLAVIAMPFIGVAVQTTLTVALGFVGIHRAGGFMGGLVVLYMFLWLVIAAAIESRLPERWRYHDPEAVVPPVDLGEARPVDETTVRQTG